MASRVNVRFVAILAVVLSLIGGAVAVTGYFALKKSSEQLEAMGDKKMQEIAQMKANGASSGAIEAAYNEALEYYSKAVNKDLGDADLIDKWADTLRETNPPTTQSYQERYWDAYVLRALRGRADATEQDPAGHERYLRERLRAMIYQGAGLAAWQSFSADAGDAIAKFADSASEAPRLHGLRALAGVQAIAIAELTPDEIDQAHEDLRIALAADADDAEVAEQRVTLDHVLARRARASGREGEASELEDDAFTFASEFIERNPDDPRGLLIELEAALNVEQRRLGGRFSLTQYRELAQSRGDRIYDAALASDPATLEAQVVQRIGALMLTLGGDGSADRAVAVVDHALSVAPEHPMLLMMRGTMMMRAGELDRAIDYFQEVLDVERPTLSLEGVILDGQKAGAVLGQINARFAVIGDTDTTEARVEAISKIAPLRDQLTEFLTEDNAAYLLVDARLAFLNGDLTGARNKAAAFNEQTSNSRVDGLMLLGQILVLEGATGAAVEQFEKVLDLNINHYRANLLLGQLYRSLSRTDDAIMTYRRLVAIEPSNDGFAAQLELLEQGGLGTDSSNPMVALVARANELADQDDLEGAIELLRRGVADFDNNAGLMAVLAQALARDGQLEEALEVAERGVELHPDHAPLARLKGLLAGDDPLAVRLETLDASNLPPLINHLERHDAYLSYGRKDEAYAQLDAAQAIDAEHPGVVGRLFDKAVGERDTDRLRELASTASRLNVDQVDGLTYQARVHMIDGEYADAETALRQAVERDAFNHDSWRLLGQVRVELGRLGPGEEAIDRALEIKPNSLKAIMARLDVLRRTGRLNSALEYARTNRRLVLKSKDFLERWLELEGSAPDGDRAEAIRVRTSITEAEPDNATNRIVLADLLIREGRLDEAGAQIDEVARAAGSEMTATQALIIAEMRARLYTAAGEPEQAVAEIERTISQIPEDKRTASGYLALADLHVRLNQRDRAIAALQAGRDFQDSDMLRIDQRLAFEYDAMARTLAQQAQRAPDAGAAARLNAQAEAAFESSLDLRRAALGSLSGQTALSLRKQVVQTLLVLKRYAEAERTAAEAGAEGTGDSDLTILRADAVRGQADPARARPLYDRAVREAPDRALPYVKRAVFLIEDVRLIDDAVSDLQRALDLEPTALTAHKLLASLYMGQGKWPEAIAQYRKALDQVPTDYDVRLTLIQMLNQRGRGAEALAVCKAGMELMPDDLRWVRNTATMAAEVESFREAARLWEQVWEQEQTPEVGAALVDSLLRQSPPAAGRAQRLVEREWPTDANPVRREILRSRIAARRGEAVPAREAARKAVSLVDPYDVSASSMVVVGLQDIFTDKNNRLRAYREIEPQGGYQGWLAMGVATLKLQVEGAEEEGVSDLMRLAETTDNNVIKAESLKGVGSYRYQQKRWEEAAGFYVQSLEANPNDWGTRNNLAYTLAIHLERPADALEHAELAAQAQPANATVLDTLGSTYLRLGRLDEAERALAAAKAGAQTDRVRAAVNLHIAELRLERGDRFGATDALQLVEELMRADDDIREDYAEDVEALRARIASE